MRALRVVHVPVLPKPYYQDDHVVLYQGDCLRLLPELPQTVSLVLTDPPYGISSGDTSKRGPRRDRKRDFFAADRDPQAAKNLAQSACLLANLLTVYSASQYWWCSQVTVGPVEDQLKRDGWTTRLMGWEKPGAPPAMPDAGWTSCLEIGLYAYRTGRTWNHRLNAPRNLLTYQPPSGPDRHPNEKPAALVERLILASTQPGDLVLDPFCGSGVVLVVARALGRQAIGIEIDDHWVEDAARRLRQGTLEFVPQEEAAHGAV